MAGTPLHSPNQHQTFSIFPKHHYCCHTQRNHPKMKKPDSFAPDILHNPNESNSLVITTAQPSTYWIHILQSAAPAASSCNPYTVHGPLCRNIPHGLRPHHCNNPDFSDFPYWPGRARAVHPKPPEGRSRTRGPVRGWSEGLPWRLGGWEARECPPRFLVEFFLVNKGNCYLKSLFLFSMENFCLKPNTFAWYVNKSIKNLALQSRASTGLTSFETTFSASLLSCRRENAATAFLCTHFLFQDHFLDGDDLGLLWWGQGRRH